ncbi:MAG: type II secretion system F family protein [Hyphomicrobiales bacterium]
MVDFVTKYLDPTSVAIGLIVLATFATVVTLVMPLLESDKLRSRMKAVSDEKERLKARNRERLMDNQNRAQLREKPQGFMVQIIERLNLRKMLEAGETRDKLRMAGLRGQAHVVSFVFFRVCSPLVFGFGSFAYLYLFFPDQEPTMRLLASFVAAYLGYYFPSLVVQNLISRRQDSIQRAWSDALDLLLICVESGMSIEAAFQRVANEIGSQSVPLAEEMTLTNAELSYLQDRRVALENLAKRTGLLTVKAVVTSLIQAERYGTPLGSALRVLAQENRDMRMAEAERKAAALPPKLTVPMIAFFLPCIFVVILGPAAIQVMEVRK